MFLSLKLKYELFINHLFRLISPNLRPNIENLLVSLIRHSFSANRTRVMRFKPGNNAVNMV